MELINKLLKENVEVAGRMNRLDKFMDTEEYRHLSDKEQRLMIIQYNAMQVYADVLLQRIDEIKERHYYEVTYNGDKKQLYLDVYDKQENKCFKVK
ncbi:DUF6275 family protein [Limosilactobacillus reuteri]|uniref:DUF6275 family protein n=1 Tax=Limosilactobacillus reuteri TaxID=1598 RepID=UPI000AE6EE57|nr:DUF6275 family protein [Limosilactobacillus reuteri]